MAIYAALCVLLMWGGVDKISKCIVAACHTIISNVDYVQSVISQQITISIQASSKYTLNDMLYVSGTLNFYAVHLRLSERRPDHRCIFG